LRRPGFFESEAIDSARDLSAKEQLGLQNFPDFMVSLRRREFSTFTGFVEPEIHSEFREAVRRRAEISDRETGANGRGHRTERNFDSDA